MNADQLKVYLEYTARFDRIFLEFPIEGRLGRLGDYDRQLADTRNANSEAIDRIIIRYFNLLSEEHYLHEQNLIDDEVWAMWTQLIQEALRSELIRNIWINIRDTYNYYQPFVEYVNGLLPNN